MSSGEILGLAATVVLVGGLMGAGLVWLLTGRRSRSARMREPLIDAYAAWLAAHLTLSRTSASFVAVVRALAREPAGSAYFALRREEVERARERWYEAMQRRDLAEATLLARCPNTSTVDGLHEFRGLDRESLRQAIEGDDQDVDRFFGKLRGKDRRAMEWVQSATARLHQPMKRNMVPDVWSRVAAQLQSIVDHWSAR